MNGASQVGATFEFRRLLDGLIYRFEPASDRDGAPQWRRLGSNLYLRWSEDHGWSIRDHEGTLLALPWNASLKDQSALPPQGVWVSRKGDRSYVYEAVLLSPG